MDSEFVAEDCTRNVKVGRQAYVLLMSGRCGSSMLMAYLNQFPDVICYPELFYGKSNEYQRNFLQALVNGEEQRIIDEKSSVGYNQESPLHKNQTKVVAVGLKAKYGDIGDLKYFRKFVTKNNVKVLYMSRTNILRAALSRYRATTLHERHGDYNMTSKGQAIGATYVNVKDFLTWIELEEKYYHDLNDIVMRFEFKVPGVMYENLLNDVSGQLNYLLQELNSNFRVRYEYVGRRPITWIYELSTGKLVRPLEQRVLKMTDEAWEKAIVNYEEFLKYFSNSRFSDFLAPEFLLY